ncbi:hypothetical protein VU06_03545, partial [Desulfobulbus sp. F3]|nr:hypothetical protein [Desulfobulbus sp. F3]
PERSEFIETVPVSLPVEQRCLIEFFVLYPEHFHSSELALLNYVSGYAAPVQEAIAAMRRLAEAGMLLPEQLLSVLPDSPVRQLVAGIVLRGAGDAPDDEAQIRELCAQLLGQLRTAKVRQDRADIQLRLRHIQQVGETNEVRELQRQIQAGLEKQSTVN